MTARALAWLRDAVDPTDPRDEAGRALLAWLEAHPAIEIDVNEAAESGEEEA